MVASFLAPATMALFQVFFWSRRRTKTPSGPSLRLKCCAASQSNDRASDAPALVIGPWWQEFADFFVLGTSPKYEAARSASLKREMSPKAATTAVAVL